MRVVRQNLYLFLVHVKLTGFDRGCLHGLLLLLKRPWSLLLHLKTHFGQTYRRLLGDLRSVQARKVGQVHCFDEHFCDALLEDFLFSGLEIFVEMQF